MATDRTTDNAFPCPGRPHEERTASPAKAISLSLDLRSARCLVVLVIFVALALPNLTLAAISFEPRVDYAVGSQPLAVAAGDFNRDGRMDLTVANSGEATVSTLLGNGDGTFGSKTDLATGASATALGIAGLRGPS